MLIPLKHGKKIEDKLEQSLALIFSKQFNPAAFFPLLAQITEDPDLKTPANLIFAIYNVLIQQESKTAYNCFSNIEKQNPHSAANVAALVVRSAYEAYTKKYKQSLESISQSIELSQLSTLDREFVSFYGQVIARIIQIYDFGAFRKEYLALMDRVLTKYHDFQSNCQILKIITHHKQVLESKVCSFKKPLRTTQISLMGSKLQNSKYSLKKQESEQKSESKSRQKSLESSKFSNINSPKLKISGKLRQQTRLKKYVNPYGLAPDESEINKCIFM